MRRPFQVFGRLDDYKYDCIEHGGDVEYFHCYDDRKAVRDSVFGVIEAHLGDMRIDCLVAEKRKTRPPLQEDTRLLLKDGIERNDPPDYSVAGESTLGALVIRGGPLGVESCSTTLR